MISKQAVKKLREIYLSELVTVYLKDMNIVSTNEEGTQVNISPMLDGILIDILRTIPHSTVGLIEISTTSGDLMDSDMVTDGDVH